MPLYADIVLPLAQPAYTFAVPEGMHVAEGTAVAVQFGPRKFYTGVVWRVHDRRPPFRTIKSIQRVLYDAPLLSAQQKALWEWIAAYYMCSAGEVMRVALPSLMKPSGDTEEEFAEDEFRPRTECYVALARELHDEGRLHEVFEKLGRRAPKQYEALLEIASAGDETRISTGEVARRLLRTDYAVLHALERKGHIVCTERERTVERGGSAFRLPELTAPQREALGSLREQFAEKPAALLHGVTGSGKTEIYIHLIAETLARGGDVLLLVPEIALTAQLIGRMERIFGSRVTPYHSKLTNRRRTETYLRLNRSQGGEFVVGVRSSIFLPLRHLQLIIVDEEHDASYKQADPAPRYNARDCAVVMARLWGGRTLLGSATPSLETWLNAEGGKYGRAVLAERYGDARPPEIFVSDTIRAAKRGERHAHFNKLLLDKMEETLGRGEQVMLFQNRRGFSPYVECSQCGWTARCPHCNVTLTYHKGGARLVCHYCGYTVPVPAKCPSCEVTEVLPRGFGTEKVEEEIARLFPEARVARLDRDSVTSERAFNAIISDFEARKTDILVGTQMITKGFDFGGVSLVGILNADNLLNNPDFRAAERAFQLMLQVAGRAGRRSDGGEVVIQTSEPGHPVIRQVVAGDFAGMARMQLSEREAFFYPPYARLTSLTLRHRDVALLRRGVTELAARLRVRFGRRVLGPMTPPVDRIRGEYLAGLLLKIESGASSAKARALLAAELKAFAENPEFKTITFICNVDPQ
ncbi:replication restart helicase PriA [Alistipes finegoldii]|uniref:replication restart helicase PriA n=1 Tax=Alistipes finegoldii TaxID=214856 RepID=UPI003AF156D8